MEVIELPGTITVHEPGPVIAHMASYRAWADQHEVPFDATIDRARTLVADHIARDGTYRITCLGGILVCRP
ncbi:Methyltransferase type 11 domain-containing protein OS=Streptomyces fumanus OX=67302 GN=GCM10018772_50430 PE=4 SV=1 [Streptomyces fumanus]